MGTSASLLFTFSLSFPDKRTAAPPGLNFEHIFLVATTLIQACIPPCFSCIHTRVLFLNVTAEVIGPKLPGFTDDKARTADGSVASVTSGRSPCLALTFRATHTPSSIRLILLEHSVDHVPLLANTFRGSFHSLEESLAKPSWVGAEDSKQPFPSSSPAP